MDPGTDNLRHEQEIANWRRLTGEAQTIAREYVETVKQQDQTIEALRSQLMRDQGLLAKEQRRWWPHLWQVAVGLLIVFVVGTLAVAPVLAVREAERGYWGNASMFAIAFGLVIFAALHLFTGDD